MTAQGLFFDAGAGEETPEYKAFCDKFKPQKTTDDCYTPPVVFDAVRAWVGRHYNLDGAEIVRPFFPGGDYENANYPKNCVVLDNPPFSIYRQIVRFFLARKIKFFLFAPHLTNFVPGADCCYIIAGAKVIYANGADVRTSFISNLWGGRRLWLAPTLKTEVEQAQRTAKKSKRLAKVGLPASVLTPARCGKYITQLADDIFFDAREVSVAREGLAAYKTFGGCVFAGGDAQARLAALGAQEEPGECRRVYGLTALEQQAVDAVAGPPGGGKTPGNIGPN